MASLLSKSATGSLLMCSLPAIAIQMVWISEFSVIIPYMKNFGMTNQYVSLVTIAGPLTGLLVAPTIGVLSDTTESRFGRRMPYIVVGALFSIVFQQLMSYAVELETLAGRRIRAVDIVIVSFICLDTAANVMMTPHRALVADVAGDRQVLGQALVALLGTTGSLLVYGFSSIFNPTIYIHEFMAMSSAVIFVTVLVCVVLTTERLKGNSMTAMLTGEGSASDAAIVGGTQAPSTTIKQPSSRQRLIDTFASVFVGLYEMPPSARPAVFGLFFWYTSNSTLGSFWVAYAAETILGGTGEDADTCGESDAPACTPEQDTFNRGVVQANQAAFAANCLGLVVQFVLPHLVRRFGTRAVYAVLTLFVALSIPIASAVPESPLSGAGAQLSMLSASVMFVLYKALAGAAADILPFSVVSSVCQQEAPERLGLFLGAVNVANVAGQLLANMLTTFTSSSEWGYGQPIFIGGIIGCGTPLCGLLISRTLGGGHAGGTSDGSRSSSLTQPLATTHHHRSLNSKSSSSQSISAPLPGLERLAVGHACRMDAISSCSGAVAGLQGRGRDAHCSFQLFKERHGTTKQGHHKSESETGTI